MKPEPQQTEVTNCVCGHRYEQHASRDYSAYCHTACGCTKYVCAEQPEPLPPPERIWLLEGQWHCHPTKVNEGDIEYVRAAHSEDEGAHSVTLGKMVMLLLQKDFDAAREIALETPLEFPDGSPHAVAPVGGEQETCGRTYRDRWCEGCKMNHRYYTGWANEGR